MARFDVYRSRGGDQLLLDCQSDYLSHLGSRFVVPLMPEDMISSRIAALHPEFVIDGQSMVMATQLAAAISKSELGGLVTNLADRDYDIVRALDTLIASS